MNASFLGNPPENIKSWILSHSSSFSWDALASALEKGNIKNGALDGIKVDGNPLAVGSILTSKIFFYQGDDGELIDDCEWIVCGFNGAVPAHVKYLTSSGKKLFLKSFDENNAERSIQDGDPVFTRSWNPASLAYDYTRAGSVSSQEGSFEYGATSNDFGTVSIKSPFAVPRKIAVALDDGSAEEALFAGHNMQMWSKHLLLDADAAGSLGEAQKMMNDSKQCTTMAFGSSKAWASSYVRAFLNGSSSSALPSGMVWTDAPSYSGFKVYATKHSFIQKAAADDAFLQSVCQQVNRNWVKGDATSSTADLFWIPGCAEMKALGTVDSYKDSTFGLCEEKGFCSSIAPAYKNGCPGTRSQHHCLLRSASSASSSVVASLSEGNVTGTYLFDGGAGFAPACSIG